MSYSQFDNLALKERFGIAQAYQAGLFARVAPRQPSELLQTLLRRQIPFALAQGSEKARSEYIIAPVLLEVRGQAEDSISIFSGIRLDVDKKQKLDGWCDFLISRSPYQFALEAPVVAVVEAKREDFEKGLSQCIAEMLAARFYNARHKQEIPVIYGCVTTGDIWRFLLLSGNTAKVELTSFDINDDLDKILGILWAMSLGRIEPGEGLL